MSGENIGVVSMSTGGGVLRGDAIGKIGLVRLPSVVTLGFVAALVINLLSVLDWPMSSGVLGVCCLPSFLRGIIFAYG